jgi:hypothetical protein
MHVGLNEIILSPSSEIREKALYVRTEKVEKRAIASGFSDLVSPRHARMHPFVYSPS